MKIVHGSALVVLAALWAAGCDQPCSNPCLDAGGEADGDADGDAGERTCVLPEVECAEGEHAVYSVCVPDAELLTVPAGSFQMGAPSGTEDLEHAVSLAEFRLYRTEVTNALFRSCVAAGCCDPPTYDGSYSGREPYYGNGEYERFPVVFVSWHHARDFCEGMGARLPTEAEWEYAARGTDGRHYPWGSEAPSPSRANFGEARDGDTDRVGSHGDGASPFGAMDMAGNVWEWVNDWYGASYYRSSPESDPRGPESGVARVARGGSFGSPATGIYSFLRMPFHPEESFSNTGFRCAR